MHGLVNRALQGFLVDTYGDDIWNDVRDRAGLPFAGFESMLHYDDKLTDDTIEAAVHVLNTDRPSVLEDLGTYLLSHENQERLRRLLRFGGDSFFDFLMSFDDLAGRAQLALPDLAFPQLEIREIGPNTFALRITWPLAGIGHVFLGALRATADDYGTLAFFEAEVLEDGQEQVVIELVDTSFASGRSFSLGELSV